MPWASSRRSAIRSAASGPGQPQLRGRVLAAAHRLRARRIFVGSATTCCWTPSCRSRSIRRRSASGRRDDPRPRGPQLLQPLGQLGGEGHVLDRRRRLRHERGEQLAVAVVVAAGFGAALDPARRGERDDEVGRPRRLAHDGVRARQRDSHPARVKAPRHGVGQPGQQPAERRGLLQLAAERREQPVAVDPRAEHPPVGPPLQPSPQRLESQGGHDRDQHRRLDGDLRAERETRRRRQHDVDARDPRHQRGVDDRPAHGDVDVVEAVLQDADDDGRGPAAVVGTASAAKRPYCRAWWAAPRR